MLCYDALLKSFLKNKKCLFDRAQSKVVKSKKSSGRRESFRSEAVVKKMMKSTSKKCAFLKKVFFGKAEVVVESSMALMITGLAERSVPKRERET